MSAFTKQVGLDRTIYIRCIYAMFGREITKYTVIYTMYAYVYIYIFIYTAMANPRNRGPERDASILTVFHASRCTHDSEEQAVVLALRIWVR